jgi:hypothetical protein
MDVMVRTDVLGHVTDLEIKALHGEKMRLKEYGY